MFRRNSTIVDKCSQHFIGTELSTLGLTFDHRARKMYVHLWFWQSRLSTNKPFRDYYGTQLTDLSPFVLYMTSAISIKII